MEQYIAPSLDVNCDPNGFAIDLDSLAAYLARLHDSRQAQGLRYSLVSVLLCVVLAKLAGEDHLTGICEWVRHRAPLLAEAFHWQKVRAPGLNTYRRILGELIDVTEFEQLVHDFFAAQPGAGQSVVVALDGKTVRGTITAARPFNPLAPDGLRTATRSNGGHGREESHTLTATRLYQGVIQWPHAAQAFKLERQFISRPTGEVTQEVVYGLTSLSVAEASAEQLLALHRSHWGIENGLHYRRDVTMGEDRYHLTKGRTAQAMTLVNNLVLGLILRQGERNVPRARRYYDAHLPQALKLVLNRLN